MSFCSKCGKELADGVAFCPSCGNAVNAQQKSAADAFSDGVNSVINDIQNTADYSSGFDPADIEDSKILSLFAYLGLLFLIPLLAKPNSRYARFHTNQGIVLFLLDILVWVAGIVLNVLTLRLFPLVVMVRLIMTLLNLGLLALSILGIVNAVTGKAKELPLIGKINILK